MDYQSFQPGGQNQNVEPQVPPMLESSHRHFLNKKFIVTFVILVALGGAVYIGIWWWGNQQVAQEVVPTFTPRPTEVLNQDSSRFNSKYFSLSFQVSADLQIHDSQNYVAVTKGMYVASDMGSTNSVWSIERFDQNNTKEKAIQRARSNYKNIKESTIVVDGGKFLRIDGDDYGTYEGDSAGKIIEIYFEKSLLHMEQHPGGNHDLDFDISTLANQIIPTIKFSSTAGWKTYTNNSLSFSIQYPIDTKPSIELNDQYNRLTGFGKLPGKYFEVRLQKDTDPTMGVNYGFLDSQIMSTNIKLGGITGFQAVSITGYGDAGVQGSPYVEFATRHNGDVYHLIFYGDAVVSAEENQILSTFKFTNLAGPSTSPRASSVPTASPNISTQKTYTNSQYGLEFTYPTFWTFDTSRSTSQIFVLDVMTGSGYAETITASNTSTSLDSWADSRDRLIYGNRMNTTLAGLPAVRFETDQYSQSVIGVKHNNFLYVINTYGALLQVLPTIKFTK